MSGHQAALLLCFSGAVLAAVLALLKIHGIITVGWFWALSPLWAPFAACAIVYTVLLALVFFIMKNIM